MKTTPKVSIITACLNSEKTIRKTIESVIRQTYENIEYIIIDGGSTDHTLDIIDEYRDRIDCIVSEKDDGIYDAFNKGISRSHGEIIGIINSDDWYTLDAVDLSVNSLMDNSAEMCCGNVYLIENGTISKVFCSEIDIEQWCGAKIRHPSVFAFKKLYDEIGLFDSSYKIAADYKWLLEVFLNNRKITYIDEEIAFFKRGGISSNKKYVIRTLRESYRVVSELVAKYDLDPKAFENALDFWKKRLIKAKSDIVLQEMPQYTADFIKSKTDGNTIVIWGSGYYGRILLSICIMYNIRVAFLVDSDFQKHYGSLLRIPINPPAEIKKVNAVVLIAIDMESDAINKLIMENHIDRNKVITLNDIRDNIYLGVDDSQVEEIYAN